MKTHKFTLDCGHALRHVHAGEVGDEFRCPACARNKKRVRRVIVEKEEV